MTKEEILKELEELELDLKRLRKEIDEEFRTPKWLKNEDKLEELRDCRDTVKEQIKDLKKGLK